MDYLPNYQPRSYLYSAGGTSMARPAVFDREAFVRACLQSERTSVTVDLSSEAKVRAFAEQVEHFHPDLLNAVVRWVNEPDKEHARDCVRLPGNPQTTASERMYGKAYTFMDVIACAQRENLQKLAAGDGSPVMHVSYGEPWQAGVSAIPEAPKPKLGRLGKFANWITRGWYEKSQTEKLTRNMQQLLSRPLAEAAQSDCRAHNVEVLKMEQVLRNDRERLAEFDRADHLLSVREAQLQAQVEKDRQLRETAERRIEDTDRSIRRIDALDTGVRALQNSMRVLGEVAQIRARHGDNPDEFNIVQINRLNDHLPNNLDVGQIKFLRTQLSNATGAYDSFLAFRLMSQQFEGKTPEEMDQMIREDEQKETNQRSLTSQNGWQSALKLLKDTPQSEWGAKLNELRGDYLHSANLYMDSFSQFCEENRLKAEIDRADERSLERARLQAQKAADMQQVETGRYEGEPDGIDQSRDAQMLRKIELEEMQKAREQLQRDRDAIQRDATARETCFHDFCRGRGTYEPLTSAFEVPGFGLPESAISESTRQVLDASRGLAPEHKDETAEHQMQSLTSARTRLEHAEHEKARVASYQDYQTLARLFGDYDQIENEATDSHALAADQMADITKRSFEKLAEIAAFARTSNAIAWKMLSEEENGGVQTDLRILESYADPGAIGDKSLGSEKARLGQLRSAVMTVQSRDPDYAAFCGDRTGITEQVSHEAEQARESYQTALDAHREPLRQSLLSDVAEHAGRQGAHHQMEREPISRTALEQKQPKVKPAEMSGKSKEHQTPELHAGGMRK